MANEVSIIETRLTANVDEHDKKIAASEKKLSDFGKNASDAGFKSWTNKISSSLQSWGTQLTVGLTAPLVLLGAKIFAIGAEYEKAMNTFQAVTRASADEMKRASAVAEKLGADMSLPATSAGDAARAMTELAKGGLSAAQAMDATRGSLMLAAAAQVDEARAAEITANALNTFGLAAGEAMRVSDLLAAASNASSAEINDIALAMQQAGSSAAALKVPIEDLVTSIGLMANAGIKGSDAGTSLKTMMAALTPSTEKAAGAMKQLGIDAFDAKGNFVGFEEIIRQAQPALARMTAEQKALAIETAFGSDAQRAANIILGKGVEEWNKMEAAVGKSGAAAELAAAKTKGLSGSWEGLVSQLETAGLKVFQVLAPTIENVVRKIADMAAGLADLNPAVIKMGIAVATVAGSAGPLALLVSKLIALGATGVIVGGVIAGAAAMGAAYATNFGAMTRVVDDFFRLFSTNAKSFEGAGTVITKTLIFIIAGIDRFIVALEKIAVNVVAVGKTMIAAAQGDWTEIPLIWAEGRAKIDRIESEYIDRVRIRQIQLEAIQRGGMKELFDVLENMSGPAGEKTARAFYEGYEGANPIPKIQIKAKSQLQQMALDFEKAGLFQGKLFAQGQKQGYDSEAYHSPHFLITATLNALNTLVIAGIEPATKAGKAVAKAIKKAFEDELKDINTFLERTFGGTGSISERILKELKKKFPEVTKELNEKSEAFRRINENLELYTVLMATASGRNTEVAKKITEIIKQLQKKAEVLASEVNPQFAKLNNNLAANLPISEDLGEAIRGTVGGLATLTINAKRAGDAAQQLADKNFKDLLDRNEELSRQLPEGWKKILDAVANSSGKQGAELVKLSNKYKEWGVDVIGIIDLMPGKWGDATRKIVSTAEQWIAFADKILAVMSRVFGDAIPGSVADGIGKIIGIFKDKTSDLEKSIDDILGTFAGKSAESAGQAGIASGKSFADGFMSKVPLIASGLATFFGSRGQGKLIGVAGGALAGFQIAGPLGAAIGAIAGLFGSGKSKEQKEAEEKAKQAAAMDMQRFVADLNSAILDGLNKGFELLEKLHGFSEVPRKAIKRFLNEIFLILSMFVEESAKFKAEGLAAAKAVTENLGDTFSFLLSGADLVEKIRGIEAVTQEDVDKLFVSIDKILDGWFSLVEHIEKGVAKRAGKIGGLLQTSLQTIQLIPATIKAMTETPDITDEQIDKPFVWGKRILDKFFELADQFKTLALNRLVKTAEAFSKIFESGKSMFEFFKLWSEYKPVDATIFDAINADFDRVKSWFLDAITRVDEWLGLEETLEDKIAALGERMSGIGAALSGAFGGAGGQNLTLQPAIASSAISALPSGGFSAAASGGGGGETHIHFHGPVLTRSQFQDEVRRALNEANRRGA